MRGIGTVAFGYGWNSAEKQSAGTVTTQTSIPRQCPRHKDRLTPRTRQYYQGSAGADGLTSPDLNPCPLMMMNPMMRVLLITTLLIFTSTGLSARPACPAYDRKAWKHWNDCGHRTYLIEQLEGIEGMEGIRM